MGKILSYHEVPSESEKISSSVAVKALSAKAKLKQKLREGERPLRGEKGTRNCHHPSISYALGSDHPLDSMWSNPLKMARCDGISLNENLGVVGVLDLYPYYGVKDLVVPEDVAGRASGRDVWFVRSLVGV